MTAQEQPNGFDDLDPETMDPEIAELLEMERLEQLEMQNPVRPASPATKILTLVGAALVLVFGALSLLSSFGIGQ
ncbi:MAG: hypothetical protein GX678_01300 [Actinomycetales bacterium]|nr:hypothetical protein [Actinomycetales bacterium]